MKIRNIFFKSGLSFLKFIPVPEAITRMCIRFFIALSISKNHRKTLVALFKIEHDLSIIIDMIAIQYGNGSHIKHRLTDYHRFFWERTKSGEKVLDIGCGDGDLANSIVIHADAQVIAIDILKEKIINCERRFKHAKLKFLQMDATACTLKESFDIIVLSNVLEHIEERVLFLKKIFRVFSPSKILIRVPMINRHWYVPLKKELGLPYHSDETHFTEYTIESFKQEIAEAELSINHYQINWGEIWAVIGGRNGIRP